LVAHLEEAHSAQVRQAYMRVKVSSTLKNAADPFLHQSIKLPPDISPKKTAVMYPKKYAAFLQPEKGFKTSKFNDYKILVIQKLYCENAKFVWDKSVIWCC